MPNTIEAVRPVATKVELEERMEFLPKYFGAKSMIVAEGRAFALLRIMSTEYKGGEWDFFVVDNGSFFMAPKFEEKRDFQSPGGHEYEGTMTAEAVGVAITLRVMGSLMVGDESDAEELLIERYQALCDYASILPDWRVIQKFID